MLVHCAQARTGIAFFFKVHATLKYVKLNQNTLVCFDVCTYPARDISYNKMLKTLKLEINGFKGFDIHFQIPTKKHDKTSVHSLQIDR